MVEIVVNVELPPEYYGTPCASPEDKGNPEGYAILDAITKAFAAKSETFQDGININVVRLSADWAGLWGIDARITADGDTCDVDALYGRELSDAAGLLGVKLCGRRSADITAVEDALSELAHDVAATLQAAVKQAA
jgi:hypothetical protein